MQPGDIIAGYRLESTLGSGAFGTVWRATQLEVDRPVAIKVLSKLDASAEHRFAREARALGRIVHPHCVLVYDSGTGRDVDPK